jgi:hypothetical protein
MRPCGTPTEECIRPNSRFLDAERYEAPQPFPGDVNPPTSRPVKGEEQPIVVVAVGVVPATGWLEGSGLTLDDGVVCGPTLNASARGVYAAGDVARWFHPMYRTSMRLEHWTSAAEQGALAGQRDTSRAGNVV